MLRVGDVMHWGRISAGLFAMGASVWVGAATWTNGPPFDALIVLFGFVATWGGLEYADRQKIRITPNDLRLSREIRSSFPKDLRIFLNSHDFGAPFESDIFSHTNDIVFEWRHLTKEFDDKTLNKCAERVIDALGVFRLHLAQSVGMTHSGDLAVPTDAELASDDFTDRTYKAIQTIDENSQRLLMYLDAFERKLREVAPDEFG